MNAVTVVTPWDADFSEDQDNANKLAHACCCDIELLCSDLLERANDRLGNDNMTDSAWCARVRMFAGRVMGLNSIVMSYMDDDTITLRHAHKVIYGRVPVEGEEV